MSVGLYQVVADRYFQIWEDVRTDPIEAWKKHGPVLTVAPFTIRYTKTGEPVYPLQVQTPGKRRKLLYKLLDQLFWFPKGTVLTPKETQYVVNSAVSMLVSILEQTVGKENNKELQYHTAHTLVYLLLLAGETNNLKEQHISKLLNLLVKNTNQFNPNHDLNIPAAFYPTVYSPDATEIDGTLPILPVLLSDYLTRFPTRKLYKKTHRLYYQTHLLYVNRLQTYRGREHIHRHMNEVLQTWNILLLTVKQKPHPFTVKKFVAFGYTHRINHKPENTPNRVHPAPFAYKVEKAFKRTKIYNTPEIQQKISYIKGKTAGK